MLESAHPVANAPHGHSCPCILKGPASCLGFTDFSTQLRCRISDCKHRTKHTLLVLLTTTSFAQQIVSAIAVVGCLGQTLLWINRRTNRFAHLRFELHGPFDKNRASGCDPDARASRGRLPASNKRPCWHCLSRGGRAWTCEHMQKPHFCLSGFF